MPEKVNGNKFSGRSNIASLNSSSTSIDSKSAIQLNSTDHKLSTLQKMADNSPYSQRFAHFTSMANNSIQKQPVSQLSKDSQSLPDNVKHGVESLSGISMDDVKVHYNSAKPAQLNAHAYAQGTDIHLASGQEKHLPHEAWHVVQQKQGRVRPTTMMKAKVPINDDQGLEKEADVMGARALQMKPFSLSDYRTGKSVQRKGIVQKVGEKWEYPEGEKPEGNYSSLLDFWQKGEEEGYVDNGMNDNDMSYTHPEKSIDPDKENPMKKKSSEEFSPNQILKTISSEKNDLSIKIEEIKIKEEETNAIEEAKEAKKPKILEVELELKNTEEEVKKAEEADRVAAKAAADLAAADLAAAALGVAAKEASDLAAANVTAAVKKALAAIEKARQKWKLVDLYNETSLNLSDLAGTYGRIRDVRAEQLGSGVHAENYANSAGQGAAVGSLVDAYELFGYYGNWQKSEKTGIDHAKLGLTLGRFITGFTDTVNTTLKYAKDSAGYMPEALTHSISLLPGIKAGLGAFRNAIEIAENIRQGNDLDEILSLGGAQGVTGSIFNDEEIKILKAYRSHITYRKIEIGVDALFNAAEVIAMIFPPAQAGIAITHTALNVLKSGYKSYLSYVDNQERKRSERIGDVGVDDLKTDRIDEKSEKVSFKEAVADLLKLKRLENEVPKNADKIREAQDNLDKKLREINDLRLVHAGSNSLITKENLETFLIVEEEVIKNIAKEVSEEKGFMKKLFTRFSPPQKKVQIINEMKLKPGIFKYDGITVDEIHKLSPLMQDYFYDKTQEAIKVACKRKHISSSERLDMMEKMLLTKFNDDKIKGYMIEKYKDKKVYESSDDANKKFEKSVKKFKLEMKLG